MADMIWSPDAIADLDEIFSFIAEDSEYYARQLAMNLITAIETIRSFPLSGRVVPEYGRKDLREKIFKAYRIVYRVKKEAVEIVAIIHSARLMPEI